MALAGDPYAQPACVYLRGPDVHRQDTASLKLSYGAR